MQDVFLYRYESTDEGTFGIISCDGAFWDSLELPDRNNKPNISCIPAGTYQVSLRYSPSFKKTLYHVKKVPKRSFILIHGANLAGDTLKGFQTHLQGCITLGKKRGTTTNKFGKKQKCVFQSQIAINEFMTYLDNQEFTLHIIER